MGCFPKSPFYTKWDLNKTQITSAMRIWVKVKRDKERNAPTIECTANHISSAYNLKIKTIIRIYSEAQIPYNTTTSQSQKLNSLSLEQPGWLPAIVNWDQLPKLKYIQLTLKFPNTALLF